MIIQKPSIFIYVNEPNPSVLKEVCAGIEEEGVFYMIRNYTEPKEMESTSPEELAWNAANDSMLGSGIGIKGSYISLQMRGMKKQHPVESYQNPDKEQCRKLGANSARAIKKLPFK